MMAVALQVVELNDRGDNITSTTDVGELMYFTSGNFQFARVDLQGEMLAVLGSVAAMHVHILRLTTNNNYSGTNEKNQSGSAVLWEPVGSPVMVESPFLDGNWVHLSLDWQDSMTLDRGARVAFGGVGIVGHQETPNDPGYDASV